MCSWHFIRYRSFSRLHRNIMPSITSKMTRNCMTRQDLPNDLDSLKDLGFSDMIFK